MTYLLIGTIMEESMILRFAFTQVGAPVESTLFERILQYNTKYIFFELRFSAC